MLKRHTPTPDEIRSRRIRRSWLMSFSIVLMALLLSIAWLGGMVLKEEPPRSVVTTEPPLGEFTFQVSTFFDDPGGLFRESSSDSSIGIGDSSQKTLLRDAMASTGQMLYWKNEDTGEEEALIYISMIRPRRIYLKRLKEILGASELLVKSGESLAEDHIGHYIFDKRGLFIFTSSQIKAFSIVETGTPPEAWEAKYQSDQGYIPERFRDILGKEIEGGMRSDSIEVFWIKDDEGSRVEIKSQANETKTIEYFNPMTNERSL